MTCWKCSAETKAMSQVCIHFLYLIENFLISDYPIIRDCNKESRKKTYATASVCVDNEG